MWALRCSSGSPRSRASHSRSRCPPKTPRMPSARQTLRPELDHSKHTHKRAHVCVHIYIIHIYLHIHRHIEFFVGYRILFYSILFDSALFCFCYEKNARTHSYTHCRYISVPVCLPACFSASHLSVHLSICPSVQLSICPSVRLSVCRSVCLSVCLCLAIYLLIYPPSDIEHALHRQHICCIYSTFRFGTVSGLCFQCFLYSVQGSPAAG